MVADREITQLNERPSKDELNKVSAWVRYHSRDYKIIVDECLGLLQDANQLINITSLISQLIIDEDIDIVRSLIYPLSFYLENDIPELKGKFNRQIKKHNYLSGRQMFLLFNNLISD